MNVGDIVGKNGSRANGLTPYQNYPVVKKAGPFIKVTNDDGVESGWLMKTGFYLARINTVAHARYVLVARPRGGRGMNDYITMYSSMRDLEISANAYVAEGYTIIAKKKISLSVRI